jgi:hypothetical protein
MKLARLEKKEAKGKEKEYYSLRLSAFVARSIL